MDMDVDDVQLDAEERMEQAVGVLKDELRGIRSGRATPGLVENIKVEYYGNPTPLRQIATIGIPDAKLIVIKPYDPSSVGAIEKAIMASDLGIHPSADAKLVRVPIPPLSEETRKQLITAVKKMAEESRQAVRNVRRDANKHVDKLKNDASLPEDDTFRAKDEIQKATDKYIDEIERVLAAKVRELEEV